jgi:hypothetical protein
MGDLQDGFWIGWLDLLGLQAITALSVFNTLYNSVAQALGFSAFTSRILATDLSQSHCNFNSHMKSSWRSLIPFLPFMQLPIPKTTQLLSTTVLQSLLLYYYSKSKSCYDPRSVGQSVLEESTHLGYKTGSLLMSDSRRLVDVGRSLWREDGSVICQSHSQQ